ncbi:glycoside hydrolase family 127 protein [Pseudarcicella hirudinis]|uniref:glycoside hydrolase family 127 protein n=1 Tax=Pseudarcicella hirudinis TaxID=1079859 RepID=UPI0035E643C6
MKINLKNKVLALAMCGLTLDSFAQQPLQKVTFVSFSKVNITDSFWKPKLDKVATTTLNTCIYQTEVTPRIRNFEKVARKAGEKHEGIYYDDSDVFKAIEAIAYSLKNHPDASLEKKTDEWIDKIAAAQQPDGYLNTYYTLNGLEKRWTDMEKHEDYNAGHLIEGAVAYFNTTGKRKLLDVAIKFANHLDETFRLANRHWITGHQEVELALVKLYRTTNDERYLKLADWYLSERGHGYGKGVIWDNWKDPAYCQDKVPVKEQTEITGHAVRAMYLYTGAADVASITGDEGYIRSMKTVWDDVVHRNMYITGGIGSSGSNEGFSKDYDLPNEHAYCETCASVGMVFWNQRMNMLTGEGKYMDILERSLYNGALDGLSLSGDRFFTEILWLLPEIIREVNGLAQLAALQISPA